ncbi:MAG: chlorohydrolase [Epulopiscium sp. Nuni2H_MBin003]|nr:MAG: chlorohydrolase [Epulopiscium sp. Nuni2H_MBin003]
MLIIGNGKVITRDDTQPFIQCGAVVIDGNTITDVGELEDIKKKYPQAEFLDAKNQLIMPAFVNTHEHIYSAFARGMSINNYNPNGFLDILDGLWWNIDRHLNLKQTNLSAMATYIECIRNGVTTIFDHHASYGEVEGSLFAIGDAAKECGVRSCLCYEVSDRDGKQDAAIKENVDFINYALKDETEMLRGMMGMHASFTISDKTMDKAVSATPDGVGFHIHVAEGIEDLHDSLKKYGKRILYRLMDHNILGEKTIAAHCIYVNDAEIELLRQTDTMVVHNPESNMGNACGCPPTLHIFNHGVLTGLGTDGYTHDMIESYKVANILHKHNLCDATVAWGEIPVMLFVNNPIIANRYFSKPLGILKKGAAADVIILDYVAPTPLNADNINSHILFGMTGRHVVTTIGNGKVLMKDRVLQHLDEEKIMADCRASAEQLAKSINKGV